MAAADVVGAGERHEGDLPLVPTADRCCPSAPGAGPSRRPAAGRRWDCRRRAGRSPASAATGSRSRCRSGSRHWRRHRRRAGTPPAAARRWRGAAQTRPATVSGRGGGKALSRSRRFMAVLRIESAHELRRRQEQRVPVLRRCRLVQRRQRGRAQRLAAGCRNTARSAISGNAGWSVASGTSGLNRPAEPEPIWRAISNRTAIWPGPFQAADGQGIAVGRLVVVQAFGQAVEPVLDRAGVEDDPVVIGQAHGRDRRSAPGP